MAGREIAGIAVLVVSGTAGAEELRVSGTIAGVSVSDPPVRVQLVRAPTRYERLKGIAGGSVGPLYEVHSEVLSNDGRFSLIATELGVWRALAGPATSWYGGLSIVGPETDLVLFKEDERSLAACRRLLREPAVAWIRAGEAERLDGERSSGWQRWGPWIRLERGREQSYWFDAKAKRVRVTIGAVGRDPVPVDCRAGERAEVSLAVLTGEPLGLRLVRNGRPLAAAVLAKERTVGPNA